MPKKSKLSPRQYIKGILSAAAMSLKVAPGAVSFKIIGSVVNAILPLITAYFAGATTTELAAAYGGVEGSGKRALVYVTMAIAAGLLSVIWNSIDQYVQALLRYKVETIMADTMYERFLSLDFWRYEDKDTADTYDKAQQFARFYAYVFDRLSSLMSSVIGVAAAVIGLVLFVPWIGIVVLIALVPGMYFQFKLSRLQVEQWNKNVAIRRAQRTIEWNLLQPDSITELRLNGLIRYIINLRNRYRDRDQRQRLDFEKKYLGRRVFSDVLETSAELVSLIWITIQIINRQQPIGQFVYVQQVVSRAISSVNSFVTTLSGMDEEISQLFDYQKFMGYPIAAQKTIMVDHKPTSIVLDNVSFRYFGSDKDVLHRISLQINSGSHIAIVGENGAGKSTLVKLLLGLYTPTSGTIMVDGNNLATVNESSWHRWIAVLQQDFRHYDFASVRDNVYYGDVSTDRDEIRYEQSITRAEAKDFIAKLPEKDDTLPSKWMGDDDDDEKGTNLSGGQWQRLALARSFYRDAPIIILDEPTSAIDALAESRIFKYLFAQKNKTIVTISHRLSTVKKADIIHVMEDGRIVEAGTHQELVNAKGAYYRLFESQLSE